MRYAKLNIMLICFILVLVYSVPASAQASTLISEETYDFKEAKVRVLSYEADGTILYRSYYKKKVYYGALQNGRKMWEFQDVAVGQPGELALSDYANGHTFFYSTGEQMTITVVSLDGKKKETALKSRYSFNNYTGAFGHTDEKGNYYFYLTNRDTGPSTMFAFNTNAQLLWSRDLTTVVSTTWMKDGIAMLDKKYGLFKLNRTSGKVSWKTAMPFSDENGYIYGGLDALYLILSNTSINQLISYNSLGEQLWTLDLSALPLDHYGYNLRETEQLIYFYDTEGYLNAVEKHTGKLLWRAEFAAPLSSENSNSDPFIGIYELSTSSVGIMYSTSGQDGNVVNHIAIFNNSGQIVDDIETSTSIKSGMRMYSAKYHMIWDADKQTLTYYNILGQSIVEYEVDNVEDITFTDDFTFVAKEGSRLVEYAVPLTDQALINKRSSEVDESL
jgi:FOG: WD40-like repeat